MGRSDWSAGRHRQPTRGQGWPPSHASLTRGVRLSAVRLCTNTLPSATDFASTQPPLLFIAPTFTWLTVLFKLTTNLVAVKLVQPGPVFQFDVTVSRPNCVDLNRVFLLL